MEKVEVDLLNKDDDNYNREVLHSVKVPMMMKIMFLKRVFLKKNTHAPYIMLQRFYGRNQGSRICGTFSDPELTPNLFSERVC